MPVTQLHGPVDGLRLSDTFLDHPDRFQPEHDPQPARCETWEVIDHRRLHAEELHRLQDGRQGDVARRRPPDHLDQVDGPDRVEEVHPGERLRCFQAGGEIVDRDTRRVRGQDGGAAMLGRPQDVGLEAHVFDDGLHNQGQALG